MSNRMSNKKILSYNLFELLGNTTFKDFAEMCDIPYNTVRSYFNLKSEPNATNLAKMAKAFGCPIETLVRDFDLGGASSQLAGDDK